MSNITLEQVTKNLNDKKNTLIDSLNSKLNTDINHEASLTDIINIIDNLQIGGKNVEILTNTINEKDCLYHLNTDEKKANFSGPGYEYVYNIPVGDLYNNINEGDHLYIKSKGIFRGSLKNLCLDLLCEEKSVEIKLSDDIQKDPRFLNVKKILEFENNRCFLKYKTFKVINNNTNCVYNDNNKLKYKEDNKIGTGLYGFTKSGFGNDIENNTFILFKYSEDCDYFDAFYFINNYPEKSPKNINKEKFNNIYKNSLILNMYNTDYNDLNDINVSNHIDLVNHKLKKSIFIKPEYNELFDPQIITSIKYYNI